MNIKTNHQFRDILNSHDLTPKELKEFNYLDEDEGSFFRYKGQVYDLGEFMAWANPNTPTKKEWDSFRSDSYFSGLVVKYSEGYDAVKVGFYVC